MENILFFLNQKDNVKKQHHHITERWYEKQAANTAQEKGISVTCLFTYYIHVLYMPGKNIDLKALTVVGHCFRHRQTFTRRKAEEELSRIYNE